MCAVTILNRRRQYDIVKQAMWQAINKKKVVLIPFLLTLFSVALSVYFWVLRYQLAMTRYFDHDELAYLYWARHMADGSLPYRDFLLYPAPGLLWLLQPVVTLYTGFATFLAGRALLYWLFVCFALVLTYLFWRMRRSWTSLFIPLLFAFLPLPSDKFMEIRPDMLGMFVVCIGIAAMIQSMEQSRTKLRAVSLFMSGVCFALALFISQKMLVLAGITAIGFFGWQLTNLRHNKTTGISIWKDIGAALLGFGVVSLCVIGWFISLGNVSLVWYSLVTLPFEANALGKLFPVAPDLFFYPNDVVYGTGGYHLGYWVNLVFWVLAICIGAYRFVISCVAFDAKKSWQELIMAGNFLVSLVLFFYAIPMKHAQYLIPSAVFVVWFTADGMRLLWESARGTRIGRLLAGISCITLFLVLVSANNLVIRPKLLWGYSHEQGEITMFTRLFPASTSILDLECVSLYYPNPYYITCMPIGQVTPLISLTLSSVATRLEETDTKYIYQGKWHRTQELSPSDQLYIQQHFSPVGDGAMLVRNDTIRQFLKEH